MEPTKRDGPFRAGNLNSLAELYINLNPGLTGSLPSSLTSLTLNAFWFNYTGLCEPDDAIFQAWINTIPDLQRTGQLCSGGLNCSLVTVIPQIECEALIALYNSTDGPKLDEQWRVAGRQFNRMGWGGGGIGACDRFIYI